VISEPTAFGFVQQFSLMKHYPQRDDEQYQARIDLLVDHFRRAAQSDDHGRRMIDWVQQNKRFCPEPVDIWDAAKATASAAATENTGGAKFRECDRCVEGFVQVFQHARWSQDRKPTAGFIYETIAEDISPRVTEQMFRAEIGKYLTAQQHARFETLYNAWPPGHHSRFVLSMQRCPRCWKRAA
jgi:hypothetical protein